MSRIVRSKRLLKMAKSIHPFMRIIKILWKKEVKNYELFSAIRITDTGPGISEEEQAKIFGRFYRAPRAWQAEGVGIGLYLSHISSDTTKLGTPYDTAVCCSWYATEPAFGETSPAFAQMR